MPQMQYLVVAVPAKARVMVSRLGCVLLASWTHEHCARSRSPAWVRAA